MKAYESPTAEFIEFKNDKILAYSTGCKCFGEVFENLDDPDENYSCKVTSYDNVEVVNAQLPWNVYPIN